MTAGNWQDLCPALPMEEGVPFRVIGVRYHGADGVALSPGFAYIRHSMGSCTDSIDDVVCQPRLDLPQGFGYALRVWHDLATVTNGWMDMMARWRDRQTTDADRVAVSAALGEVTHASR